MLTGSSTMAARGEVSRRFNLAAHMSAVLRGGKIGVQPRSDPLAQEGTGVRSDMEFWRDVRRLVLTK